ncbi:MAG: PIG-L family deacetylase [Candidatus Bathyarchaeota archaeon]|nr:PIG-L family deacetylase [Candidatus Termiticorpusculum sp.]
MVLKSEVILAVGAHPDDIELGCGGTISAASKLGKRVIAVFLSKGEQSGNPEIRPKESIEALSLLGVKEAYFGDFPDSEIPCSRQAIDFLEAFFVAHKPDTVLTHTVNDIHQDHRQVGWLSISAFRNAPRLLAYETPRVTQAFSPTYFVDIANCVNDKWLALKCHFSQKTKRYITYESMVNLASFRGSQVSLPAAEAFEVVRYIEKTEKST